MILCDTHSDVGYLFQQAPSFGFPNEERVFCSSHKRPGMEYLAAAGEHHRGGAGDALTQVIRHPIRSVQDWNKIGSYICLSYILEILYKARSYTKFVPACLVGTSLKLYRRRDLLKNWFQHFGLEYVWNCRPGIPGFKRRGIVQNWCQHFCVIHLWNSVEEEITESLPRVKWYHCRKKGTMRLVCVFFTLPIDLFSSFTSSARAEFLS